MLPHMILAQKLATEGNIEGARQVIHAYNVGFFDALDVLTDPFRNISLDHAKHMVSNIKAGKLSPQES